MIEVAIRTLGSSKVDNISIRLEHVDLLNGLDWLNVKFLERCLQLLVVYSSTLMDLLDLSPWGTLSANHLLVYMIHTPVRTLLNSS